MSDTSDIPAFGTADIAGEERAFTVDQRLAALDVPDEGEDPVGNNLYVLTVEDRITAAKLSGLHAAMQVRQLLDEKLAEREQLDAEIAALREAEVIWGPIENRLLHGPARRTRGGDDGAKG